MHIYFYFLRLAHVLVANMIGDDFFYRSNTAAHHQRETAVFELYFVVATANEMFVRENARPPTSGVPPHLMASTQLSRSSSLVALSLYDWCLPCTTRPLFSVLQALIFCPLGLYNSRQYCANKHTHTHTAAVLTALTFGPSAL